MVSKIDRTGEISFTKVGTKMKIVKYNNKDDLYVEFQDEYKVIVHGRYKDFKTGNIKNPYDKSVEGVGYLGIGKFNYIDTPICYTHWSEMLKRCYNPYRINKGNNIAYKDVFVEKDLLNLQNFGKWFEENYYEIPGETMCLDKDILSKGNKLYSKDTMIFVPQRINLLFTKSNKSRGDLPIGVTIKKDRNKINLYVSCSIFENGVKQSHYIGRFPIDRPFQAFTAYKTFKEKYIKQVAEEYKDRIPQKLYEALYNYEVEIND